MTMLPKNFTWTTDRFDQMEEEKELQKYEAEPFSKYVFGLILIVAIYFLACLI